MWVSNQPPQVCAPTHTPRSRQHRLAAASPATFRQHKCPRTNGSRCGFDGVLGGKMCVLTAGVGGLYFVAHVLFCFLNLCFVGLSRSCWWNHKNQNYKKVKDWRNKWGDCVLAKKKTKQNNTQHSYLWMCVFFPLIIDSHSQPPLSALFVCVGVCVKKHKIPPTESEGCFAAFVFLISRIK